MKCDRSIMALYAVTDRAWLKDRSLASVAEASLKGGVTCLQLREKDLTHDEFLYEALEIKTVCKKYGVPFIVNDDVEVAVESGADGVHIGQHDEPADAVRKRIGPEMMLGVSVQTVEQALKAEGDGADYLGVGAVYSTGTKADADDVSFDTLKAICDAVSIPVVAIGGINKDNISGLRGSGIDGVAVVSAIFAAPDAEEASQLLRDEVSNSLGV